MIFLSIVIYQHYQKELHEYDMHVGNQLMQCHLSGTCHKFKTKIIKNIFDKKLHTFYNDREIYMLFKNGDDFFKTVIPKQEYLKKQSKIKKHVIIEYSLYFLVLLSISIFFALYATRPLKKALELNDEFVKDILHDFNTPLASLNINYKILKKQFGSNEALTRSDQAIQNILLLQKNLYFFLDQSRLKNETLNLHKIVEERVEYFKTLFPLLTFYIEVDDIKIFTNQNAFIRVVDNLISNAGKYNRDGGFIKISFDKGILIIKDSGKGIKNPKKIFDRYYKESDTGTGIGLHVVKKLCDELNILITVKTIEAKGSSFLLNINKIII